MTKVTPRSMPARKPVEPLGAATFQGEPGSFEREHNARAEDRWIINGARLTNAAPARAQLPPLLQSPFGQRREIEVDRGFEWRPPGSGARGIKVMSNGVFNPAIAEDPQTKSLHLLARARDDLNVSRIVHLVSTDGGLTYEVDPRLPVAMAPELLHGELAEWAEGGGCEDARLFQFQGPDGVPRWRMAFTVYNADRNVASIAFACAERPGGPWTQEGLAFPEEAKAGRWTKSFVAAQLSDGSYVGWGSRDISIPDSPDGPQGTRGDGSLFMAISPDARRWKIVADPIAAPREGQFDGRLVESAFVLPLKNDRFCLFVNGDSPPAGYQLGYQVYRPPTGAEAQLATRAGGKVLPLVLEERSSGPCFSHRPDHLWEREGPVEKVIFTAGGAVVHPADGSAPCLRISYGFNDMGLATADAALTPEFLNA